MSGLIKLQETKITPHFSVGIKTKQATAQNKKKDEQLHPLPHTFSL
jgi:hypothetical protein